VAASSALPSRLLAANERTAQWRVALIERNEPRPPDAGRIDLRVSAISRASQRILQAAGAWAAVEADAAPYSDMVVWDATSRHDAADALRFSAAETGEPDLGAIVENLRLQWALVEASNVRKATVLRTGLEQLEVTPEHVRLELSDQRSVRASLVIAADGGQSRTRELAGIERVGRDYDQAAVVAHLRPSRPHEQTAWQRFTPQGPLALLPLATDGCRPCGPWTRTVRASCVRQARGSLRPASPPRATKCSVASSSIASALRSRWGAGRLPRIASRASCWSAMPRTRSTRSPDRAPISVLLDAAALVEVLGDAVANDEDWTGLRTLRRYERWRRSENTLVMGLTDGLNRLFGNANESAIALRRFGLGVVATQPWMRRALIERALGVAGEVPRIVSRVTLA
jgi:2-octaprenylphenol hydroxylase